MGGFVSFPGERQLLANHECQFENHAILGLKKHGVVVGVSVGVSVGGSHGAYGGLVKREPLKDDTCWCNGARVTPISTNTIYRRGATKCVSADEEFDAEQDVEDLEGTCRPFPLWAASSQRVFPFSSAFPACLDDTAETANSPHQLGKLLKY